MAAEVNMTPEQLQKILEAVLAKATQMNPLEQKKWDEDLAKQRRKDLLAVEVGKAEQEAQDRRRNSCSHMRFNASAGKLSGQSAPRGTPGAEWCTGGQAYQNGLVMVFCSRCHTSWWFQPTQEFYTMIIQNGIDGMQPPDMSVEVCIGCYKLKDRCTCVEDAKMHYAAHPTVV